MKKKRNSSLLRCDFDKVYYLEQYEKAVQHGKENIHIDGIAEELDNLEQEKEKYCAEVESVAAIGKETEQLRYEPYKKWLHREKIYKRIEIILMAIFLILSFSEHLLPVWLYSRFLSPIFQTVMILFLFLVIPAIFITSKVARNIYGSQYIKYVTPIKNQLNELGRNFTNISLDSYNKIDDYYLLSLDPAYREMILFRRDQEMRAREEKRHQEEVLQIEKESLKEQQKARQAQEELLEIERKREERYRKL